VTATWEEREAYDPARSTVRCPKGCYDLDWCLGSLAVPCARPGRTDPDPSGQFNPACGCLLASKCPGCQVCTVCDACYCHEE
jgi:hypothetical protein